MNKKLYKTIINRNTGLIVVVAENKMAVFNFSGSLKNNFDAAKVQGEIDLGVEVMQDFSRNVQDLNRRKNIELDELKEELKAGTKTQEEYDQAVKKIETQKVIINMLAGGLISPSDSALGIATSTVSPAVSYAVGQHFKNLADKNPNGKLTTSQEMAHIATHAVLGAITANANGADALTGALSAGGAEAVTPIVTSMLYGKEVKPENLTAEQKETVSTIAQAVGVLSGSVAGDSSANAYIGNTVATNAVENNYLFPPEQDTKDKSTARKYEILAKYRWDYETDEQNPVLISEPTDEEKAELAKINDKIATYDNLSEERDKTYKYYEDACLRTANRAICKTYHQLSVVQRKKWTDIGVNQFKDDLDPVTGLPNANWDKQEDYANKLHNYDPTGKKIMDKENGKYPNTKYLHKNKQYEVVVDSKGNIIEDFTNAGTFNYYAPSINPAKFLLHKRFDMDGYFVFGNGGNDKTTFEVRDTWYSNNHWYTSPFSYITNEQRRKAIKVFNEINDEWLKSKK